MPEVARADLSSGLHAVFNVTWSKMTRRADE